MSTERLEAAKEVAREAGALARGYFSDIGALQIEAKGAQDLVSNADLAVETFIRERLAERFAQDGIIGEEHAPVPSSSGWTWVIDPIDGTANFVNGIPQWCVILACVFEDQTRIGVIYEPSTDEMFWASDGDGAFLNERRLKTAKTEGLHEGSVGVGMNGRTETRITAKVIATLADKGGIFFRNASGGLMLAYVAAGRLIGYTEPHMNAWDCLAGQLMIAEAGGRIETQSAGQMLKTGGRVIAACPDVFDELLALSVAAERG
ncbi:MAG: inositol monophosphatase [Pseudomonadota bacterium]